MLPIFYYAVTATVTVIVLISDYTQTMAHFFNINITHTIVFTLVTVFIQKDDAATVNFKSAEAPIRGRHLLLWIAMYTTSTVRAAALLLCCEA